MKYKTHIALYCANARARKIGHASRVAVNSFDKRRGEGQVLGNIFNILAEI